MDPELTSLDTLPRRASRIARRRAGETVVLIGDGVFYELDTLLDLVWRAADGRTTLGEIAEQCAAAAGLELGEALAGAAIAIRYFIREGLVTLEAPLGQVARGCASSEGEVRDPF